MFIGRPSCTLKRICHRLCCFKQLAQTIVFQATSKVLSTFMAANFGRGKVIQLVPKLFFLKHFAGVQGPLPTTNNPPLLGSSPTRGSRTSTGETSWAKMRRQTPNQRQQNVKVCLTPKQVENTATSTDKPGKPIYWWNSSEEERQQRQILQGVII